jgi:hypothetical protein
MNKFEDIKEGDTVYVHQAVRHGFNSNRYFYIPMKVVKTTKTQFTCENDKRYKKDNGYEIGGNYGDRVDLKSKDVFDQRKEMLEFKTLVKKITKATDLIYNLDRRRNKVGLDIDIKTLEEFTVSAEKLLAAIKE